MRAAVAASDAGPGPAPPMAGWRGDIGRVLMTVDAVGGVWCYALTLARGLAARGVEVLLAVEGPPPDDAQLSAARAVSGLTIVSTGLGLEWHDRAGPLAAADACRLRELGEAFAPDIVHVNGYRDAAIGWPVPVVVVAHSCVASWWRACRGEPLPEAWDPYARAVWTGLARADAVVAPTAAFSAELQRHYGRIGAARVIPNGSAPASTREGSREPFVLSVGRFWDEAKGVRTLERAARGIAWPVRVVGAPPTETSGALEFLGRRSNEEVARLVGRAGIYCAPSLYEPFGLAALEAASAATPLVLADIATLRELWDGAAVFVPPRDAEALARAIQDLVAEPDRRAALGRAAGVRARRYGADRMTDAYLDLYRELVQAPAARSGIG